MPLKRTPPKSPGKKQQHKTPNATANTAATNTALKTPRLGDYIEPLSKVQTTNTEEFVATSGKRKFDGDDHSDVRSFMAEMRVYLANFAESQDKKLFALQQSISDIKIQNEEISKSIDFMSQKYEDLSQQIHRLEQDKKECNNRVAALEDKIDFLEKKSRSSYVEIRNLPKVQDESKESLVKTIQKIGQALNVTIDTRDVNDIYRINTKFDPDNKPVVVELNSVLLKNNLIGSAKRFNKLEGTQNLNTHHLQIPGPPKHIYIGDSLTPRLKRLFFLAREFAKTSDFNYCWSSSGSVFLRRREGSAYIRVNKKKDLDDLKKELQIDK